MFTMRGRETKKRKDQKQQWGRKQPEEIRKSPGVTPADGSNTRVGN